MRFLLLLSLALLLAPSVQANEYGHYDVRKIMNAPDGNKKNASIDLQYFDLMLGDLSTHATNYPPKFDTPEDKQRATNDAKMLSNVIDVVMEGDKLPQDMYARAGFINAIAHNLDIQGAAQKATNYYQKLLAMSPADPRSNFMFGAFLAGIGKAKEAVPLLEKAYAHGLMDAAFTLGMAHFALGNKEKALSYLEIYKKSNPNDTSVDKLIAAIQNGTANLKRN